MITSRAPGRINLIGEHTDYNGGLSMPAAINRWVEVSASSHSSGAMRAISKDNQEEIGFNLYQSFPSANAQWEKFIYGAIGVLRESFFSKLPEPNAKKSNLRGRKPIFKDFPHGLELTISGNVPQGAGLSSSAALEIALLKTLLKAWGFSLNGREICLLAQQIEHRYLGIQSGLLDQYASCFSKKNQLLLIDFRADSLRYFPLKASDYLWVTVNSTIRRKLAGSKYQERVMETRKGLALIHSKIPHINHLRDVGPEGLEFLHNLGESSLENRIRHFYEENLRVLAMKTALSPESGLDSLHTAGQLLNQSHDSLRDLYAVSCPELDFLVETAQNHSSCLGSRMMGGGFGGCTLNLVHKKGLEDFKAEIEKRYLNKTNLIAETEVFELVAGAMYEEDSEMRTEIDG